MSRELLVEMGRRTLEYARIGSGPLTESVVQVPSSNYHDPERWQLEMDRVFRRVPLVLGFSAELAEPNSYRALTVLGVPILLTRDADGTVRSFVNMCSHRGATLIEDGEGTARRFSCPYHGWTYDPAGALVGIRGQQMFGDIDACDHGLTPLACEERAGIVFGTITPGAELHLDEFLHGYDELLAHHDLANCHYVGRQNLDGPNWKIAFDGYIDQYHLPVLHRKGFGSDYCDRAAYDTWGPHLRMSPPDKRFLVLDGVAEDDWDTATLLSGVWTVFPHVSMASFLLEDEFGGGRIYMVSQLFPGDDPETSHTTQNFFFAGDPTEEQLAGVHAKMDFLLALVRDEDYHTGLTIQQAVKTGAKPYFMYGRNELGGQHFHGWVDELVGAEDAAAYSAVLGAGDVTMQR